MINLKTETWEIKDIDTVLFDKDGTFIDLHYFWGKMTELRVQEIMKVFNMSENIFNELCLCLGYDVFNGKMLKNGITALYSRNKIIEIFVKDLLKYNIQTSDNEITKIFDLVSERFYSQMYKYTKPIEEAINFIKMLNQKGVKCGIVTSDSVTSTELTLKHFNWQSLFGVIIGRESTSENKESGVGTKKALEILNSSPSNTLMIGDAPMDYLAAQNAGIKNVVLVATGQIEKQELLLTVPNVVNSLNEIFIN